MSDRLHPYFRFDSLVVGAANRLAATAARSVAESPGAGYNPLFVYADPGLGKTHLLMAIGHLALEINPNLRVEYLTLDDFVEAFHTALAAGQGDAYRRHVGEADLLLLDDVQFLAHRREMQAELIRLTDYMQTEERQIVLASDRPPAEIEALDDRLIRRFAGGLIVDIAAPDFETRAAILSRRAQERKATFDRDVVDAVAGLPFSNVRELIGALNRLIALQAVEKTPLGAMEAVAFLQGEKDPPTHDLPVPVVVAASPPPEVPVSVEAAANVRSAASDEAAADEFGSFLSEVVATVSHQVESWRSRVAEHILRWEGQGYRTARLEALLEEDVPADIDVVLEAYQRDIDRLQELASEAEALASDIAGSAVFRDPDQVAAAEDLVARAQEGVTSPPGPSPLWQLEDLVESGGNRIALRSASAVAQDPGVKYNPLVIVGGSGRGKTHLLHGIGNVLAAREGAVVACLDAADFTSQLIDALEQERVAQWRTRYQRATALLIDDVNLLAGKERTQEELYLLFNKMQADDRQMVFTSAVPLAELTGIEPRLLTRLEGGLVVELPAPERDIRLAVADRLLRAKLDLEDDELAAYLASRPVESVRSLHGLVQRVLTAAEVQNTTPTAALAREVLEGPPGRRPARPRRVRSSGIVPPTAGGPRSHEKMVWTWPDAGDRVIEEWR
ncbi:MAG: DnaA/Hda family protein [Gemmatimonadales bacterium]